ncbi:Dynein heavy chain, partial [Giardia lamblia P15]
MSRQDTPARREDAPRHTSSAEYFMELVRAQEHASRQTPHLSDQLFTYNEEEYAPFDLDPVRPAHIAPADETLDCACTRTLETGECTIRGAPGSLLHRLEMHSEASLPPEMLKNARPAIISNASKTLRTRNAETKKIITSERLVGGMKTGADVIAYFARTPDKAVVKIVYCSPTTTPVDKVYNPYNLRVIDGDVAKKLPVYYTISQNGVMRVVNSDVKVLKVYDMINNKSTLNPSLYKLEKTADKNIVHSLRQDGIPGGTNTDFFALDPYAGSDGASDWNDTTSGVHCEAPGDASSNDGFQHRSSGIDTGIRGDKSHRRKPEQTDPNILSRTIESDLVTAFHDDASEFTMLDRWILEASNFDILRNYKFFKHFYQLKTLQTWIAFRKYKRYCRNRKSITKSLFLSRPHFLQSLKNIWAVLYDIKMSQCI